MKSKAPDDERFVQVHLLMIPIAITTTTTTTRLDAIAIASSLLWKGSSSQKGEDDRKQNFFIF